MCEVLSAHCGCLPAPLQILFYGAYLLALKCLNFVFGLPDMTTKVLSSSIVSVASSSGWGVIISLLAAALTWCGELAVFSAFPFLRAASSSLTTVVLIRSPLAAALAQFYVRLCLVVE